MSGEKGSVAVFVLTFFLLCTAAIVLIVVSSSGWTVSRVGIFCFSACLSAMLMLFEWRSDRYAVMTFTTGMLGMGAVISIITTFSISSINDQLSPLWLSVSVVFTVAAVSLAVVLFRLKKRPDDPRFPNVLRREFGNKVIMERDGVQIVSAVLKDGTPALSLLLQNCWLSERIVRLKFDTGNIHVGTADPLLSVSDLTVVLGPAEVAKVIVPVRPNGKPFNVFAGVVAEGRGGKRVRMWEGQSISGRISPGRSLLTLFLGVLIWGGGIKFKFPALPSGETDAGPETTIVWRPNPEHVPVRPL